MHGEPTQSRTCATPCTTATQRSGQATVILINPYELGRQPFALAQPAAWLEQAGFAVVCIDLSLQKLDPAVLADAVLVAVHVGMHTATRIALAALPRIRALAPHAHVCVYGLYAPMNESTLRAAGAATILGGEVEPALLELARSIRSETAPAEQARPLVALDKIAFRTPARGGLPPLERYAHLNLADGTRRISGFAEGSRGCKHLCRHCPVVPVYQGRFRIVPVDVVLNDIRQQAAAGAQHISFGDPDFFNGPTHALRLIRALHAEFPQLTYDATIKVQHLIAHADLLPELRRTGCVFITSAVEAVDDRILEHLAKNHTRADFTRVVALLREVGIDLAPTFVAFTPWTTLEGYVDLLRQLVDLRLVESVPAVQLSIRLLIPQGSYLLALPGFTDLIDAFDPELLGYPWRHADPGVDRLQREVQELAAQADAHGLDRRATFTQIWQCAHAAIGRAAPALPDEALGRPIPHMSEPWYCCAEPTSQQLQSF